MMPRIRTVKPSFWTDSKVVGLSPLARLLFVGSWNFADDYGALEADPVQLKLQVLPAEPCDVSQLVSELLDAGLLQEVTDGVETFWRVAGWERHQKVDRRSTSRFGDPSTWTATAEVEQPNQAPPISAESRRVFDEPSTNGAEPSTSPAEDRHIPPISDLGREGKGREGRERRARTREHPLPDGWQPNDSHRQQAADLNVNCQQEADRFRTHAAANDRRQRDWDASFRLWLDRTRDFQPARTPHDPRSASAVRTEPEFGSPEWERRQDDLRARERAVLGTDGDQP